MWKNTKYDTIDYCGGRMSQLFQDFVLAKAAI